MVWHLDGPGGVMAQGRAPVEPDGVIAFPTMRQAAQVVRIRGEIDQAYATKSDTAARHVERKGQHKFDLMYLAGQIRLRGDISVLENYRHVSTRLVLAAQGLLPRAATLMTTLKAAPRPRAGRELCRHMLRQFLRREYVRRDSNPIVPPASN